MRVLPTLLLTALTALALFVAYQQAANLSAIDLKDPVVTIGLLLGGTATLLFSALTTVASFGSLVLSPHRGTASMGELLSIAIGFTLVCTLIVLPVAFRFVEHRKLG